MKEQTLLPQDKPTPRERFLGIILIALYVVHFAIFMTPEPVWNNFHAEIFCAKIYPEIAFNALENNSIKPTTFPMSAYIFWGTSPLIAIYVFCFFVATMWSLRRVEIYISRRKSEKHFYFYSLVFFFAPIWLLSIHEPSAPIFWFFKPFQNKLAYYFLYQGLVFVFSMSIVLLVMNIRARIYLNRRK